VHIQIIQTFNAILVIFYRLSINQKLFNYNFMSNALGLSLKDMLETPDSEIYFRNFYCNLGHYLNNNIGPIQSSKINPILFV